MMGDLILILIVVALMLLGGLLSTGVSFRREN
jgi:hypothetical protein